MKRGMEATRWHAWGRYLAAALGAAAISAFAFVLRSPVPVFDWIDLGVHELGHILVGFGPRMLHFLAGSVAQVAVPAGLAVYFGWRQRDAAGAGFCLAWAGTSAWDVSVYISDAPVQALPLVGGGTHDWAYLLGPQGWDAIGSAGAVAGFVDFLGMAAAALGAVVALSPAVRHAWRRRRATVPDMQGLPVREPMAAPDPAAATPASAFPGEPRLVEGEEGAAGPPADDPWLAASQLPFYHGASSEPS